MDSIKSKFEENGGKFLIPEEELKNALPAIDVFVFDWDGVYNDGIKGHESGSGFSEADAMGVNMLRFNYWRKYKKQPFVFIISGENNKAALEFAKREHLNGVYSGYLDKRVALQHLRETYNVSNDQMAFMFDDILDISAGQLCRLSFCIGRKASPLFRDFVIGKKFCAYITGSEGGAHAVREICELIMGLGGEYEATVNERIDFSAGYAEYLMQRNEIEPAFEKFKK